MWGTSIIIKMTKGLANITLLQSENISRRLIAHEARKADVEVYKTNTIASHKAALDLKAKFAEKLLDATPEDRLRLRQDIEYIDQDIRQLGIYREAEKYLPSDGDQSTETNVYESEPNSMESNQVWLDIFNEYARRSNEVWRADLLSRALALEVQEPGSIGQRALWFIGTVDEPIFHSFAALLDISARIDGEYILPATTGLYDSEIAVEGVDRFYTVGHAAFTVTDLGLMGDSTSQSRLRPGLTVVASYGSRTVTFDVDNEIILSGIIYTSLGQKIAKLYEPKSVAIGEQLFASWIEDLRASGDCRLDT